MHADLVPDKSSKPILTSLLVIESEKKDKNVQPWKFSFENRKCILCFISFFFFCFLLCLHRIRLQSVAGRVSSSQQSALFEQRRGVRVKESFILTCGRASLVFE